MGLALSWIDLRYWSFSICELTRRLPFTFISLVGSNRFDSRILFAERTQIRASRLKCLTRIQQKHVLLSYVARMTKKLFVYVMDNKGFY